MARYDLIRLVLIALATSPAACSSSHGAAPGAAGGMTGASGAVSVAGSNPGGAGASASVVHGAGGVANGAGGSAVVASGGTPAAGGTTNGAGGATLAGGGGTVSSGGTPSAGGSGGNAGSTSSGGAGSMCRAGAPLAPGETKGTISVGGAARTYIVHVPSSYSGTQPVPLVIDFHPIFGTGAGEKGLSGYAGLSDKEGFVVAFPDGIDNAWDVGPCCTMSRAVDDVAFAKALVSKIEGDGCIDAKRVYATGFSMGGGMSHYLACHAADVFAAVVPASFDLLTENAGDCMPARPISVLSFRGTADNVVPYAGGASNPPNGLPTIHFLGAVGTFEKWAMLDGCTGMPTMNADGCKTYSQCSAGVEVTLCTIDGGGHAPGNAQQGWAMMKKHPMP